MFTIIDLVSIHAFENRKWRALQLLHHSGRIRPSSRPHQRREQPEAPSLPGTAGCGASTHPCIPSALNQPLRSCRPPSHRAHEKHAAPWVGGHSPLCLSSWTGRTGGGRKGGRGMGYNLFGINLTMKSLFERPALFCSPVGRR